MLKPAIVRKYLPDERLCEVEIPGVTDGADTYPLAEIMQNLGDKSEHTEIRILEGDRVWVMFNDNDPNKPVILGFRAKERDNTLLWRRWHHDNVQIDADDDINSNAGKTITFKAGQRIRLEANGSTIVMDSSGVKINGKRIDLN